MESGRALSATLQLDAHRRRRPVADAVRDLIAADFILGEQTPPGARLPSEHALAERYGVSRVTVRAAMRSLREAGLVSTRQGVGAVVLPSAATVRQGFDRLCSLETFASESGKRVSSTDVDYEETEADAEAAEKLGLSPGDPVVIVRRVKRLDGIKVAWNVDTVPRNIPFEPSQSELRGSVLDALLAHDDVAVEYADTAFVPIRLPADIATRLDVKTGVLALLFDTVVYTEHGIAVDWGKSWLLHSYFRFVVRRRKQI